MPHHYLDELNVIAKDDVERLKAKDKQYGGSWKKRGGIGAFMMLARKWDRLEQACGAAGYDIFQVLEDETRVEGIIDDIRDLRGYLLLVEAEARCRGYDCVAPPKPVKEDEFEAKVARLTEGQDKY